MALVDTRLLHVTQNVLSSREDLFTLLRVELRNEIGVVIRVAQLIPVNRKSRHGVSYVTSDKVSD